MLASIEEDEQIIKLFEEIDESFSSIKTTLRELRIKIGQLSEKNKDIVSNFAPWINFFEIETRIDCSPLSELSFNSLKYKELGNSPATLNSKAPNNPFIEAESSELFNKSIFKKMQCCSPSSSTAVLTEEITNKENSENRCSPDSDETEIIPFRLDLLPAVFQKEPDLFNLYAFIQKHRAVSVEAIISNFKDISHEKLEILVSLLCRKNFVRQKNSKITIEK